MLYRCLVSFNHPSVLHLLLLIVTFVVSGASYSLLTVDTYAVVCYACSLILNLVIG